MKVKFSFILSISSSQFTGINRSHNIDQLQMIELSGRTFVSRHEGHEIKTHRSLPVFFFFFRLSYLLLVKIYKDLIILFFLFFIELKRLSKNKEEEFKDGYDY